MAKLSALTAATFAGPADETYLVQSGVGKRAATSLLRSWVDVRAFGALGDGTTIDTTALQSALDSRQPLYFPPGSVFQIDAPLVLKSVDGSANPIKFHRLSGGMVSDDLNVPRSEIRGNFAGPLIRTAGKLVSFNDTTNVWFQAETASSGGCRVQIENMRLYNTHARGHCLQLYNAQPMTGLRNVWISSAFAGVLELQGFGVLYDKCVFDGAYFVGGANAYEDPEMISAYGLHMPSHSTCLECQWTGWGTALFVEGTGNNVIGGRFEANGTGIQLGADSAFGSGSIAPDIFGTTSVAQNGIMAGFTMEANVHGIRGQKIGGGLLVRTSIAHGSNAPLNGGDNNSAIGYTIESGNGGEFTQMLLRTSGTFKTAAKTLGSSLNIDFGLVGVGVTGSRPLPTAVGIGTRYYDTTLSKPLWSDGALWLDAAGTPV